MGLALILGNDLAGSTVWTSLSLSPVVTPKLIVMGRMSVVGNIQLCFHPEL